MLTTAPEVPYLLRISSAYRGNCYLRV